MRIYAYVRVDPNNGVDLNYVEYFTSFGHRIPRHRIIVEEAAINISIEYREKIINLINHSLEEKNTLIVRSIDCLGGSIMEIYKIVNILEQKKIKLICLDFSKNEISGDIQKIFIHVFKIISNFEVMMNDSADKMKKRNRRVGRPEILTKSKKKEVVKKFKNGQSVYSIAKDYSVSRTVIQRIVNQSSKNVI